MDLTATSSTSTAGPSPIDWLFGELFGMYGNAFLDKFSTGQMVDGVDSGIATMKRVWLEKIRARGMTLKHLKRGLVACERLKFPPSWAEFLEFCLPSLDALSAYHEAVAGLEARGKGERGEWTHPAIYWAASLLRIDLMGQSYSQVKDRWASILKGQMERTEWAEIPEPRVLLEAPDEPRLSREGAAAMLRELDADSVTKRSSDQIDHRRWSKKIIRQQAAGDKNLLLIQIQFAQAALGVQAE